jgi:hypothetical protein
MMSAGIRSGVNWMRLNARSRTSLSVRTSKRLAQTGHALEQHVAAGKNRGQGPVHHGVLADHDASDFTADTGVNLTKLGDLFLGVHGVGSDGLRDKPSDATRPTARLFPPMC